MIPYHADSSRDFSGHPHFPDKKIDTKKGLGTCYGHGGNMWQWQDYKPLFVKTSTEGGAVCQTELAIVEPRRHTWLVNHLYSRLSRINQTHTKDMAS